MTKMEVRMLIACKENSSHLNLKERHLLETLDFLETDSRFLFFIDNGLVFACNSMSDSYIWTCGFFIKRDQHGKIVVRRWEFVTFEDMLEIVNDEIKTKFLFHLDLFV